ncbi:hypothetical protein CDL15_Pgr023863 [Punica granatum]|uniref:Uncharacterized protein n=1 Tax=Punica granatum TaxID=22663 RepID=A0A218Y268_PUNGR|nr:hypothetical protein CDL15_Pgr023863 [Punica granatum]
MSGSTRETKSSSGGQSKTCSKVQVVLGCVQACFRVQFTCPWIGRPGSPVRKGVCESSGVPQLKQDVSEARPDMSLVTLAPRGIFRVPYWAPFDASVIR